MPRPDGMSPPGLHDRRQPPGAPPPRPGVGRGHARSGAYADRDPVTTPPWVPGMDVAGVVTELGVGVEHLAVGDAAMGIVVPFGPHGAYREDKVLSGNSVVRTPKGST